MTTLTEANLIKAAHILEYNGANRRCFNERIARYLDARDQADAKREAEHAAFREEVLQAVNEADALLEAHHVSPDSFARRKLRALKRSAPEPDSVADVWWMSGNTTMAQFKEKFAASGLKLVKETERD